MLDITAFDTVGYGASAVQTAAEVRIASPSSSRKHPGPQFIICSSGAVPGQQAVCIEHSLLIAEQTCCYVHLSALTRSHDFARGGYRGRKCSKAGETLGASPS